MRTLFSYYTYRTLHLYVHQHQSSPVCRTKDAQMKEKTQPSKMKIEEHGIIPDERSEETSQK